ncbi:MAG: VOC family protein, partial [Bacteroidota bacterium]
MSTPITGLHHVTAIAGSARGNLEFYRDALGLRFVKKTVNFDDPGTYHLYYGDETGSAGSIMTFFPWEGMRQGRTGAGQTVLTHFAVPVGSLGFWTGRLPR